jgi:hypothetical protein
MKNKSDSPLSSLSTSPPDPFKEKPIEVTIDDNHNIENVQLPSLAMARRHYEDEPTESREEKPMYDEFALAPRYEPTAAVYSNVRGDRVNNSGSRKRSLSIDPADDYPVPQYDDMSILPERQIYKRKKSGRTTMISPQQHWNQMTSGMTERERQRYSDDIDQRRPREKNSLEIFEEFSNSTRTRK